VIDINKVDMLQMTPSRMQLLLTGSSSLSCLKGLRTVMIGGEAVPESLVSELRKHTEAEIYNMYGPTETTVWSSVSLLDVKRPIDIGSAIANTRIYILDAHGRLKPVGVHGELCISGDGVARGYLGRRELTEQKFLADPFFEGDRMYRTGDLAKYLPDGRLQCLGRIDQQVKIRGYRIEPEEIEKHLKACAGVTECVVIAKCHEAGDKYLAAYYSAPEEASLAVLRESLSAKLPDYMVPEMFVYMESLPLTPNGKIDRGALPEPGYVRPKLSSSYKEADTEAQSIIAQIWQRVLNRDLVGVEDNFFELGGNSLLIVRMHWELEKRYPGLVSVADIFAYPTVSKLAGIIENRDVFKIKDLKIDRLQMPEDFFACAGGYNDGTVIRTVLGCDLYRRLKSMAYRLGRKEEDILISALIYMLSEVSGVQKLPVHISGKDREIRAESFNLEEIHDINDLIYRVSMKMESRGIDNVIPIRYLDKIRLDKDKGSVLVLYTYNFQGFQDNALRLYDIIVRAEEAEGDINFIFEYDGSKISKEKMEELIFYYMDIIEVISAVDG
ncbi:AMP-binding enzyme, partial [Anaerobacterium chartisolvens]